MRRLFPFIVVGGCLLIVTACGSSSTTSVTAPSTDPRCALSVTAEPRAANAPGATGALRIGTNRECSWTVSTDVDWIAFAAARSGQGEATIPFTISSNAAVQPRRGQLVINDQRVEITQEAAPCVFTLDSDGASFDAGGGERTVRVSAQTGCSWNAVSHAGWIAVRSAGADGSGAVNVVVESNSLQEPRTAGLTIAGRVFTVSQAAAAAPAAPAPPQPPTGPQPPTPTPGPPAPPPAPTPTPTPAPTPPAPAPTPTPTPTPPAPTPAPAPTPPPPAPPPTPQIVTLEGKLSDLSGKCPALTFLVDGQSVRTNGQTRFTGGDCDKVKKNSRVEITGERQSDGVVLATRVAIEREDDDADIALAWTRPGMRTAADGAGRQAARSAHGSGEPRTFTSFASAESCTQ
jgi:hypothetical protein